jgi:acyl-CoA synthetase (AMP-forming)/AMP-acid ligase II
MLGPGLLGDVLTLVRRGVIAPALPHRTVGQVGSLLTYGIGLFGELRQAAKHSPNRVAVIDAESGELTYDELLARVERTSEVLRGHGVTRRDRVGLLARNHVGALAAMAAADALGADLVLLNTGLTAPQLAQVAIEQDLVLVIHDDEFVDTVATLGVTRVRESDLEEAVAHTRRPLVVPPSRGGRTIILTSGTTGSPKGATRRIPPGIGPLATILDRIPFTAGDRVLVSAPIFHAWGYAALQLAFAIRATVVLQRRFDPAAAREALEEYRVQVHVAVPVMLHRMLELPSDPAARARRPLRITAVSGSALPGGLATAYMDEYGDVLYNLYGSTEASWVSIATPHDLRRAPDTAGRPPRGTTVRILDDGGREVPDGVVGRVFCANELVFEGYTSGQTKEFVDGLISTGDLGCLRDGLLFLEGREDDMIVSGGENVYPDEVAHVLDRLDGVREAAVVGVPDERFGQRLVAVVARRPGSEVTADDVLDHCRGNVSRHAVPREVHFVDELPRNATGKILARELRERLGE